MIAKLNFQQLVFSVTWLFSNHANMLTYLLIIIYFLLHHVLKCDDENRGMFKRALFVWSVHVFTVNWLMHPYWIKVLLVFETQYLNLSQTHFRIVLLGWIQALLITGVSMACTRVLVALTTSLHQCQTWAALLCHQTPMECLHPGCSRHLLQWAKAQHHPDTPWVSITCDV